MLGMQVVGERVASCRNDRVHTLALGAAARLCPNAAGPAMIDKGTSTPHPEDRSLLLSPR